MIKEYHGVQETARWRQVARCTCEQDAFWKDLLEAECRIVGAAVLTLSKHKSRCRYVSGARDAKKLNLQALFKWNLIAVICSGIFRLASLSRAGHSTLDFNGKFPNSTCMINTSRCTFKQPTRVEGSRESCGHFRSCETHISWEAAIDRKSQRIGTVATTTQGTEHITTWSQAPDCSFVAVDA